MQKVAIFGPVAYLALCIVIYFTLGGLAKLVIGTLTVYFTGCLVVYLLQNALTYPRVATGAVLPTEDAALMAAQVGLVPWKNTTPGASAPQGYVHAGFEAPTARGTIVFFHGNGGWSIHRLAYANVFIQRGFRVFLYEYPGYGGRPGRPSEAAIVPDAQAVVRALDQAGYGPIYVWGESLGSGVAAAVCGDPEFPVSGLVLLTPWDRIANVGASIYPYLPVRLLMIDKYDSIANLAKFRHPVCVVYSDQDEVIPPPLALNLIQHLPPTTKVIRHANAGHEDWPASPELTWWDEALDFIAPKKS